MALNTPAQTLDNTDNADFTDKVVRSSSNYAGLVTFQVTGMAGATVLTAQGTVDGTNYVSVGVVPLSSTTMAMTIAADGIYRSDVSGVQIFRVKVSTAGTGTSTVTFFTTDG